ncbi:hypothetical protein V8B97DRAFT_841691 [Scleroderma yunnanense]
MDTALDNIDRVLSCTSSPEKLTHNLTWVFSKLLDPSQDVVFVLKYTDAIKARLGDKGYRHNGQCWLRYFRKGMCIGRDCEDNIGASEAPSTLDFIRAEGNIHATTHHTRFSLSFFVPGDEDKRATLFGQVLSHDVVPVLMQTL